MLGLELGSIGLSGRVYVLLVVGAKEVAGSFLVAQSEDRALLFNNARLDFDSARILAG